MMTLLRKHLAPLALVALVALGLSATPAPASAASEEHTVAVRVGDVRLFGNEDCGAIEWELDVLVPNDHWDVHFSIVGPEGPDGPWAEDVRLRGFDLGSGPQTIAMATEICRADFPLGTYTAHAGLAYSYDDDEQLAPTYDYVAAPVPFEFSHARYAPSAVAVEVDKSGKTSRIVATVTRDGKPQPWVTVKLQVREHQKWRTLAKRFAAKNGMVTWKMRPTAEAKKAVFRVLAAASKSDATRATASNPFRVR